MKILISEATEAQLRQFAEQNLGMSIHPSAKLETVRAKVQAAWDKPEIVLADAPPSTSQAGDAPHPVTKAQEKPAKKMVRIIIARTEEAGGDEAVQVGVNGRVMLIPRGREVDIPEPYFHVLENAIKHVYEAAPDGKGLNPVPRKVPMYPYQVVSRAA